MKRHSAHNYLSTLSAEGMQLKINQISIGDDRSGVICVYAKIFTEIFQFIVFSVKKSKILFNISKFTHFNLMPHKIDETSIYSTKI